MTDQDKKIDDLISLLNCDDGIECRKARRQLIKIGQAAVPALTGAASSGGITRRWEAMKALGMIGGRETMDALVQHLGDADAGIRWVAADSLSRWADDAVVPVLKALISNSGSLPFREGVHHFLIDIASGSDPYTPMLEPVIKSLEESAADMAAPVAAEIALDQIRALKKAAA